MVHSHSPKYTTMLSAAITYEEDDLSQQTFLVPWHGLVMHDAATLLKIKRSSHNKNPQSDLQQKITVIQIHKNN